MEDLRRTSYGGKKYLKNNGVEFSLFLEYYLCAFISNLR